MKVYGIVEARGSDGGCVFLICPIRFNVAYFLYYFRVVLS